MFSETKRGGGYRWFQLFFISVILFLTRIIPLSRANSVLSILECKCNMLYEQLNCPTAPTFCFDENILLFWWGRHYFLQTSQGKHVAWNQYWSFACSDVHLEFQTHKILNILSGQGTIYYLLVPYRQSRRGL